MTNTAAALALRRKGRPEFKLGSALSHSIAEAMAVMDLKANGRTLRARQEIISEGARFTSPFILVEGIALRYRIMREGQRLVLSVILPGDFAGVPSCFFSTALYSVRTLTPAVILPIPMPKLISLIETRPQIATRWLWEFACETAVYAERLVSISRRTATERVAHFLLELFMRMRRIGLTEENSFYLPLTQGIVSDALGLSIPYVNRVLHQLREERLVHIEDQFVVLDNIDELAALVDFEQTYLCPLSIEDFTSEAAA